MKIDINKIPLEGLILEEEVSPSSLELETDTVKFSGPIKIKAEVSRITNAVTVNLSLSGSTRLNCSRCLGEFNVALKKGLRLNYQVDNSKPIIDTSTLLNVNGERSRTINLDQDIKEEIILDYPIKSLCNPDCKGLCPKCGRNLNEGGCSCASTKKKTF
ncbi:MAG: DUF177 domain-containing protein [Candidatus Omnitrophota bacterium]|nr:DUF177 domain-containing protein [Candidatus Omnitrophota bacterium]